MKRLLYKLFVLFLLLNMSHTAYSQVTKNIKYIGDSCSIMFDSIDGRIVYRIVDSMPSYKGGGDAMRKVIAKNLKWPNGDCCWTGTIFVEFVIEPEGTISNRKILRGEALDLCGFNTGALRVLDYLTDWVPGKCNGTAVPVRYVLPMKFSLK